VQHFDPACSKGVGRGIFRQNKILIMNSIASVFPVACCGVSERMPNVNVP
jgi:hypothetical protein